MVLKAYLLDDRHEIFGVILASGMSQAKKKLKRLMKRHKDDTLDFEGIELNFREVKIYR